MTPASVPAAGPVAEPARPVSLADRLARWRNRLVASPRFQRFAASFPLTRPIAQRQSQALFDLCAGFVYAQVLQACVQLDLFRILDEAPRSAAELAPRLSLTEAATERLLGAAAALDLVERRSGGRYGLAMLGGALLGNPGVGAMIAHHPLLYADLADPLALLRGENSDYLSREQAQKMADALPDCTLVHVQCRGHSNLLDEPASLGTIRAVLARCDQR